MDVSSNRPEFIKTSDNQVNFLQHIMSIVKTRGRVGVVMPDSVLTDGDSTKKVRDKLLKDYNLHTILRLPTGIFYANGVKTNVLFFEKGEPTKDIWVYDYRTGVKHTLVTKPMTREHLQEFVDCYCTGHMEDRKETYDAETNPNGRWRRFTMAEVESRDDLNFKWIDFTEEDERSVTDILDELEDEAKGILGTVKILKSRFGLLSDEGIYDVENGYVPVDSLASLQIQFDNNLSVLKSKLIDTAIQGKLTEQLPEDGTAEELYQQIIDEKTDIVAKRKGRKDNSIHPVDDNVPFEIPNSWKWIRFGETGFFRKGPFGSSLTKSMFVPKSDDTIKVYEQQHAINKDHALGTYYITKEYFDTSMKGFEVMPGDIIVSCAGTIGETYIMPDLIERGIINQALMRITVVPSINKHFFLYYFDSQLKKTAQDGNGSAITNIPPFDVLKNLYFPLPPLAEQKRIVQKLEEILPLCE